MAISLAAKEDEGEREQHTKRAHRCRPPSLLLETLNASGRIPVQMQTDVLYAPPKWDKLLRIISAKMV